MSRRIRLGESLVESGLITEAQLDEALKRRVTTGERIGEALVGLGFISERDLLRTLAQDADIPFLEPRVRWLPVRRARLELDRRGQQTPAERPRARQPPSRRTMG